LRPTTRGEGYEIQKRVMDLSGGEICGWKIAATSAAGQKHIRVDGPIAGRMLAARVVADGGSFSLAKNTMRVAEIEFAFRMGRDLPPRATPYTLDEALDAVASLHPAIELPDSRFSAFERAGAVQLIADNAGTDFFVLGPAADIDVRKHDLAQHAVKGVIQARGVTADGVGANALGDPRIALVWLANELSTHGIGLRAGEVVTTGTCVIPIAIAPGDHITGDFGVIGSVSAAAV
jgi:2-keto-4-pentenoate hydratase